MTAVLFTCAGQRVDIVSAFSRAGATTVATDLDPLAPALWHADHHAIAPRIDDAGYVDAIRALCEEHDGNVRKKHSECGARHYAEERVVLGCQRNGSELSLVADFGQEEDDHCKREDAVPSKVFRLVVHSVRLDRPPGDSEERSRQQETQTMGLKRTSPHANTPGKLLSSK